MKPVNSFNDDQKEEEDSNISFGGKGKLCRKNVIKRKNTNLQMIQQQMEHSHLKNKDEKCSKVEQHNNDEDGELLIVEGNPFLEIVLPGNATAYRVYCTIRQTIVNRKLMNEYLFPNKYMLNNHLNGNKFLTLNTFANPVEHLLDEELKFGPLCPKNVPKVVSLGLNVVLDIIKDSHQKNPKICIRSLEALNNLLTGMKPESLKYEPLDIIGKFFELLHFLISSSISYLTRKYSISSASAFVHDTYHSQVLELSISSLITLSIAHGDTAQIVDCVKTLLLECNNHLNQEEMDLDNYYSYKQAFTIEIPEIMVLLKKNVCSFLLGKLIIPEWHIIGFPIKSLCETFSIKYDSRKKMVLNQYFDKQKFKCSSSFTFNGQYLILYRCKQVFVIGSGYNNTPIGQELSSCAIESFHLKENNSSCCSRNNWIGFVNGELFLQPNSSWSHNQVLHLDSHTLKVKASVPLINNIPGDSNENTLPNSTLATTDGDYIILVSSQNDEYFTIRELKPLKIIFDSQNLLCKEKITFSMMSQISIRMSSVIVLFCGNSSHKLSLPSKKFNNSVDNCQENQFEYNAHIFSNTSILNANNLIEYKSIITILTGKDFALMLSEQGKVYYTGNAQSLGIRHVNTSGKWAQLTIPKPVKITQISIGHDGHHALLLGEDGSLFFVGIAKRGEDGESAPRSNVHRFHKAFRVKKFAKLDSNLYPTFIACNHGTSAIAFNSGDIYLFGKDVYYCNPKGAMNLVNKNITSIKSMALGKAHILILTNDGRVITSGFSNKGQCGLGQTAYVGNSSYSSLPEKPKATSSGFESNSTCLGHFFVYGKTKKCSNCFNCTEFGAKCSNVAIQSTTNDDDLICGCAEGNSGCLYCSICATCSKDIIICKRSHGSHLNQRPQFNEWEQFDNSGNTAKLSEVSENETNKKDISKLFSNSLLNEIDLENDSSTRIGSISPTIIPLSLEITISQIAAGLHHSVLLTQNGDVYTFGSNQFGQLGTGDFKNRYTPTKINIEYITNDQIIQVAAGSNHTVLLSSSGNVFSFGSNQYGQLGRSMYSSCKLKYVWNSFPSKMKNIGPEYGRIANFISASGDFTFIKYDEILLSSNLLTSAKLVAEKNNLLLIPPRSEEMKTFENLFSEKSCKHQQCSNQNDDSKSDENYFNNFDDNILIISRNTGNCSILSPQIERKIPNSIDLFDTKNQLNFRPFSYIFIDKYYHNLWTYDSNKDQFGRFNLVELEASFKIGKLCHPLDNVRFPNYSNSLCNINSLNDSTIQYIRNVPTSLQPDITVPSTNYCFLRHSPQQLAIELLSFLSSLTYSHLFGISVNDKQDQFSQASQLFLPEDYHSFCRFEDYGGGWGYPPRSVEAIRFSVDSDIILGGIALYGGRGEYSTRLKLFDIGYDGGEIEKDGDLIIETDSVFYECPPRQKYQIFFDDPILIHSNRWYVIWAAISGPSSDCGSSGQPFICTSDQIMFHFKPSKLSNNGTDVNSGQIPIFIYKSTKSKDFQFPFNNLSNASLLSIDEEGFPFTISKDFSLNINSSCLNSLYELLEDSWKRLQFLLQNEKFNTMFSGNDDKLVEKLCNLLSEVKKQIYIANFILQLIRAYVQIFSTKENEINLNRWKNRFQHNFQDLDELQKTEQSFTTISKLLLEILTNPIEIDSLIKEQMNGEIFKREIKRKLSALIKCNNFFIEECHQTFFCCTHTFYPTNTLKWNALNDLLQDDRKFESGNSLNEDGSVFTEKQLYILSAMIQAFCVPNLKVISFFSTLKSSITESNEDNCNSINEASSSISDSIDCVSKKNSELFSCEDLFIGTDNNLQMIVGNLLSVVIKPIKFLNQNLSKQTIQNQDFMETLNSKDYKKFANYCSDNNSNDCEALASSVTSSITSSTTSSSSSSLQNESSEKKKNLDETDLGSSHPSTNFAQLQSYPYGNPLHIVTDSKAFYSKKLVSVSCDLMLKLISELNTYAIGLINFNLNPNSQEFYSSYTELITPSRFYRRSTSKSWDTGSGNPEAICFSVNKSGIHISGVRVYSFSANQVKYQLQLLDQISDDNNKNSFKWRKLTSITGVLVEDNTQLNDFCELRFERPYAIMANVKYAIVFKSFSISSYNGDMGLPQVRGDDDTLFTFMDCSLSKNGTNLNRGQIPQILYYNIPIPIEKSKQFKTKENVLKKSSSKLMINSRLALQNIVALFKNTIDEAKNLLKLTINNVQAYTLSVNNGVSTGTICENVCSTSSNILDDNQLLNFLCTTFESTFFKTFFPSFILHINSIIQDILLAYELSIHISSLIPLITDLNRMVISHFSYYTAKSPYFISNNSFIVESEHPYKPSSVTSYLVKFPKSVSWMSIEFDPKSSTAQVEDYLELYVPNNCCRQFTASLLPNFDKKISNHSSKPFRNLLNVHSKLSGSNFANKLHCNLKKLKEKMLQKFAHDNKVSTNCIFVPGNELVIMLKTSSNYVHAPDENYYGFKAQIIGYEIPNTVGMNHNNDTNVSEMNCKESQFNLVTQLIQNFENDIVYFYGLCIETLLNSTSENVINSHINRIQNLDHNNKSESLFNKFDSNRDIEYANQIFANNSNILSKGFNFEQSIKMEKITNFNELPISNVNSFLEDFIKLVPESSGSRLAFWFQSESFISPNCCIIDPIDNIDFCCQSCIQLLNNNMINLQKLCSRCYYQLFVKTIPQQNDCKSVPVNQKVYIKIVTRDQHKEIAFDSNSCIVINIRHINRFVENKSINELVSNDLSSKLFNGNGISEQESPILQLIKKNPYQVTVKDKSRFHAITMMKTFEEYSFEELRFNTHSSFKKNVSLENIPVKHFENGYYLASWIPTDPGCYKIELVIDGETGDNDCLINVTDVLEDDTNNFMIDNPLIQPVEDQMIYTKLQLNPSQNFEIIPTKSISKGSIKHCIRKFICNDSAGLRIRTLPSLQSEEIGIVAVNGLLTIIDQFENDDGIWVRLSNESIQAYCNCSQVSNQQQLQNKESFLNDNFELNLNDFMNPNLKASFTFTMRTEAWTMQFNRHFNRTLLVSIDSEDGPVYNMDNIISKVDNEYFATPNWFKIVNCSFDGHVVRNSPNLFGTVIGMVQPNDNVNGVESLQNEFGIWIRLSRSSLPRLNKSEFCENEHEGWMLAQSVNRQTFLQCLSKSNEVNNSIYCDLSPGKYNVPESDDNCYSVPVKKAISSSAAKCIRAIFAAFVWHEGILHDVLTAASYLKFNAKVTKEYIKIFNREDQDKNTDKNGKNQNTEHKVKSRSNRNKKTSFRHSFEVSQLLSCWSSDINSNLDDIFCPILSETNNNINNNNNNTEIYTPESTNEDLIQIPEILINLLTIWDFVSTECLKIFTNFHPILVQPNSINMCEDSVPQEESNNISDDNDEYDADEVKLGSLFYAYAHKNFLAKYFYNDKQTSQYRIQSKENVQSEHKKTTKLLSRSINLDPKILSIQQLYSSLQESAFFLLTLVPSNAPSLTGIIVNDDLNLTDCHNSITKLFFEHFQDNLNCFQSLQQLGIHKSVYEQRLAEEKLSEMAIYSFEQSEDAQQLLSPKSLDKFSIDGKLVNFNTKKSFKFYRSISVGMNDSNLEREKNECGNKHLYHNSNHNKSSEALCVSGHGDKFNVPFLCKPSSRLITLIQECINNKEDHQSEAQINQLRSNEYEKFAAKSPLLSRDVFKFIFSCYDIELFQLINRGTISAAAYRAVALNILNWLLLNVSSTSALHDIMWNFVSSLTETIDSQEELNTIIDLNIIDENNSVENVVDLCRHPFENLYMAGESAEFWITDSFHRLIRSISNLLPLLPMGSSLQQMAVRCFGIHFQTKDHIFLYECKVFSHISSILNRSSCEDVANQQQDEKSDSCKDNSFSYSLLDISNDVTSWFEMKTTSHQSMTNSLRDNSTETFWESANDDRNKYKSITLNRMADIPNENNENMRKSHIKFICVYIDNTRDIEYKVSHVSLKIMMTKNDAVKYCNELCVMNLYASSAEIEFEKLTTFELDPKFCGWLTCEITEKQSKEIVSSFKYLKIELLPLYHSVRVRQVKVLTVSNNFDESLSNELMDYGSSCSAENRKLISSTEATQVRISNCESETLRVFRHLTSQVFGKLLANESNCGNNGNGNNFTDKHSLSYQNNENDLREHMVGILFSHSGKLTELQKQVCCHIVREIHIESGKVCEEWESYINSDDGLDYYFQSMSIDKQNVRIKNIPNDAYCFELLSLVLALSGSDVGCSYLSKQNELFLDILTILHTTSDRVKRQVLSLIRRVIPNIKPIVFANILTINELPNLNNIFARTNQSLGLKRNSPNYKPHEDDSVLYHIGLIDIFLSCIAKSLTVQTKIKGSGSRFQVVHTMASVFKDKAHTYKQWWLMGSINRCISQSIITLLKNMIDGSFGEEWSKIGRNCLIEKILNLIHLSDNYRVPEKCIKTPTLWLAMAALSVLDENDAEMLSSNNLFKFYDKANGNSSKIFCENHDDGETIALVQCNVCGNLCTDCDRFLHLNNRTKTHKRYIFKEDLDSIKVDIHEGCGRAKLFWALIVSDSNLLKAIVEFRIGSLKSNNTTDSETQLSSSVTYLSQRSTLCRFCSSENAVDMQIMGYICSNEDCKRFAKVACTKILDCNHLCHGIRDEDVCLPCLFGCSGKLRQDGDDMCMVCFSESLFAAPCIQLECKHIFHAHCIRTVLEKRWTGGRITFTFSQCPICKRNIEHPSLSAILEPIRILYEDVKRKALMRLEYESLHRCQAITVPGTRFYNDPLGYALEKYSYYLCFKCEKAYFGGEARCDAELDDSGNFNPQELICGSCSDVAQAQICPKHGTDFLEYKCRFCCSVAVYFCFGSTHFCNSCHEDFQRLVSTKDHPKCPVGPRGIPLEGDECPLHVVHPPTGEEFALGCGVCRNAHTF